MLSISSGWRAGDIMLYLCGILLNRWPLFLARVSKSTLSANESSSKIGFRLQQLFDFWEKVRRETNASPGIRFMAHKSGYQFLVD